MTLSEEIKAYRLRHGLTQKGFGELVGAKNPQESTWDWEHGRTPRSEMLTKIRQVLNADQRADEEKSVEYHKAQIARLLGVSVDRVTINVTM